MAWSERSQFQIFVGLAVLVGVSLIYRDRHREAPPDPTLRARETWGTAGIASYAFDIRYYGAVPEAPPMRIIVRDGAVHSAELLCRPPNAKEYCRAWLELKIDEYGPDRLINHAKTIPQLFDRMSTARANPNDWKARLFTEFNPTYGFPERFSFDNPHGEDEEYGFEVSNFTVSQ